MRSRAAASLGRRSVGDALSFLLRICFDSLEKSDLGLKTLIKIKKFICHTLEPCKDFKVFDRLGSCTVTARLCIVNRVQTQLFVKSVDVLALFSLLFFFSLESPRESVYLCL
mmetsp:Transcript_18660/g.37766  ORF Transcript_18660/g.37766 Transcript_18660/m.37766 type:complete len:112 (-) Transcript_18660:354-689(-)